MAGAGAMEGQTSTILTLNHAWAQGSLNNWWASLNDLRGTLSDLTGEVSPDFLFAPAISLLSEDLPPIQASQDPFRSSGNRPMQAWTAKSC